MNTEKIMPLIPLRDLCVFPYMVLHFDVGREKSINALEKAMIRDQVVFLATQTESDTDLPMQDDFYTIGTIAKVKQMLKLNGNNIRVLVEGVSRGEIDRFVDDEPFFAVAVNQIEEPIYEHLPIEIEAIMRSVVENFETYAGAGKVPDEIVNSLSAMYEPGKLADVVASHLDIKISEKHDVLAELDPEKRLTLVNEFLVREIEIVNIEKEISNKVKTKIGQHQKEYFLREQIKTLQEELGDGNNEENPDEEVKNWLEHLKELALPEKIHTKVEKEIKRFAKMQPFSSEATVIRSYVEWVFDLPWNTYSEGEIDLKLAEQILDEDHYGLEKVKERVIEYLAVMELVETMKAPILCLVGPPGVGKTSIAKSIARSVNREFVRMSLGGVRDEAEIRGHRRTYIGAIPGRIINGMKEAGTMDPVFLFDEIDKLGSDFRGDPSSALLEVLDPEQNKDFTDHYLEFPFDLSKVMFVTTANSLDTIPRPLLDRMEIIDVPGYTEEEKVKIAEKYLIPKQKKEHGLEEKILSISEPALRDVINYYTRESGVRSLERRVAAICRKAARKVVRDKAKKINVSSSNLENYLGKKMYRYDVIEDVAMVGSTTGLAWTIVGGTTLTIETVAVKGNGSLSLTGQLGEVMKESASAGISYLRSIAKELGVSETFYKDLDIHMHIPEGATPKDGPSAGVTMFSAMVSTLTGIPARQDVAMTGEITLRGNVLPVGGVREKVLAAHRAGIKKVLLPMDNERDIEDIPANVRKKMEFVLIAHAKDALEHVLTELPKPTQKHDKASKTKTEKTAK
ncbi:MAG: endopeptidase La [Clostridiales Family XIII bacterium]|jgi:ATP-dependent Lon protease|nr:endopeptidase La [Clostridiales Family XIII bacterium]